MNNNVNKIYINQQYDDNNESRLEEERDEAEDDNSVSQNNSGQQERNERQDVELNSTELQHEDHNIEEKAQSQYSDENNTDSYEQYETREYTESVNEEYEKETHEYMESVNEEYGEEDVLHNNIEQDEDNKEYTIVTDSVNDNYYEQSKSDEVSEYTEQNDGNIESVIETDNNELANTELSQTETVETQKTWKPDIDISDVHVNLPSIEECRSRHGLYTYDEVNDAIMKLAFMLIVDDTLCETEQQFNKSTYISKTDSEITIRIKL